MSEEFKPIAASEVTFSQLMLPSNTNFNGKIHGGYMLSLMDQIAFACASKHSENYCVTASVDTVDFKIPIEVGELVVMKASVNYVGNTSMIIGIRVEAENVRTGVKKHCNSSYFTMVAKDDNGKSVKVPGLIIDSETALRRFVKGAASMKLKQQRKIEFTASEFRKEDYLDELSEYRIQLKLNK